MLATPLGPGAVGGLADALLASTYSLQRLSPRPGESTSGSLEQVPQAPPLSPVSCPSFRLSQVFSACFLLSLFALRSSLWRLGPGRSAPLPCNQRLAAHLESLGARSNSAVRLRGAVGVRPAARRESVETSARVSPQLG